MNFFYLLLDDNTLEFRPVSCKPLVVALPNMHHLAKEPEIDLRAFANEPFVLTMRYQMPGVHGR